MNCQTGDKWHGMSTFFRTKTIFKDISKPSSAEFLPSVLSNIQWITQGKRIQGYRGLLDFGGKQMFSCSDRVCTYSLLMIKKWLLKYKQRKRYFFQLNNLI